MNRKLSFAAIVAPFVFGAVAMAGLFAFSTENANACSSACGAKFKADCGNGITIYTDSAEGVLVACRGGSLGAANVREHPVVEAIPLKNVATQRAPKVQPVSKAQPVQTATTAVPTGGFIQPSPPVCRKDQKDFVRWSDATLTKYGLTIICDKNYGGLNLKPANSGDPTRLNGKIIRFGPHAPSFGPQTSGFGYRDGGDRLYVKTADGLAVYQKGFFGWSLSLAK